MKTKNNFAKKLVAMITAATLLTSVMPMGAIASVISLQTQTATVTITGFEELCPDIAHQTVPFGTGLEELNLPAELTALVTVQEGQAGGSFGFGLPGVGALRVFAAEPYFEPDYCADSYDAAYCSCYAYEYECDCGYEPVYACEYAYYFEEEEYKPEYGNEEEKADCTYAYECGLEYDYEKDEEDDDDKPDPVPPMPPILPAEPQAMQVPVTWHVSYVHGGGEPEFDGYTAGVYVFTARVYGDFVLAGWVEMPSIKVTVEQLAVGFAAAQSVATGDYIDSGVITTWGSNLPWTYYSCGTLVLGSGSLWNPGLMTRMMWPFQNELSTIVFTGTVEALGDLSILFSSGIPNLTALEGLHYLQTGNVTNMHGMFWGASGLTELDLSGWDTSNVTNMGNMFNGASGLTSLDLSGWNTSNVTNMHGMFWGASGLTSLDLSGWDTSSVTYLSGMFFGASGLTSLDLSGWDTSSVTYLSGMFLYASGLTELDLSGWDTSNVMVMDGMFFRASGLTELNLSGWDDCPPREEDDEFYMIHERRQFGRRC